MARIYTRSGDDGTTGLIGGQRISKDAVKVEAYGSIDELNALLGVVRSYPLPGHVDGILQRIQDELFTVGANLALPAGTHPEDWKIPVLADDDVAALEHDIDECEKVLEPLQKFILPGGTSQGAMLHLARTVARRAERRCIALSLEETVDPKIIHYLNRISDLCFVLARHVNFQLGREETHPTFGRR